MTIETVERSGDGFRWERIGHVAQLTLDRPGTGNALSRTTLYDLHQLWTEVAADRGLRCVIVTGEGDKFCTGAYVAGLAAERAPLGEGVEDELFWLPGRSLDVPVITAVNGTCAGAGLHFVADADIAIAGEAAWFVDTHVEVGQVSGIEPPSLALRMPMTYIAKMALAGRSGRIGARDALVGGLVCEVTPREALLPRAYELAAAIAAASPEAIRQTRRVLRKVERDLLMPSMAAGFEALVAHWSHPDCREGPLAWSEKRLPQWAEDS